MHARRALPSSLAALVLLPALVACTVPDPPTVTPAPAGAQDGLVPGDTTVMEMTMPPPPQAAPMPVSVDALEPYVDEDGRFSLLLPEGWTESRQPPSQGESDVVLGTVFQAPDGDGILTVTHFDNGREPAGLGTTANVVLRDVTGWMSQPGYRELARESVVERPGEAMRIEIEYERSNGVPMHSLVLFQIDGTTFSMVNASVESSSWDAAQGNLREVLGSYRVPADASLEPATAESDAESDASGEEDANGEGAADEMPDEVPDDEADEGAADEVPEEEPDEGGDG